MLRDRGWTILYGISVASGDASRTVLIAARIVGAVLGGRVFGRSISSQTSWRGDAPSRADTAGRTDQRGAPGAACTRIPDRLARVRLRHQPGSHLPHRPCDERGGHPCPSSVEVDDRPPWPGPAKAWAVGFDSVWGARHHLDRRGPRALDGYCPVVGSIQLDGGPR